MNDNRFYVYALLDPRKPGKYKYGDYCFLYEPFYIGKGTGNRIKKHSGKKSLIASTPKNQKIKKLLKLNMKYIECILHNGITSNQSLIFEICLISLIGRKDEGKGPLTNATDGGDGASLGHVVKKETKRKISQSLMGKMKGRKLSQCWKDKISNNNAKYWLGKNHSLDTINKIKEKRKSQDMSYRRVSYLLTSPDDTTYIVSNGLQKFCDKFDLNRGHLIAVAKGIRNHSKGWKCSYQPQSG